VIRKYLRKGKDKEQRTDIQKTTISNNDFNFHYEVKSIWYRPAKM